MLEWVELGRQSIADYEANAGAGPAADRRPASRRSSMRPGRADARRPRARV